MNSMKKGVLTVVMATIITSVMIIMADNSDAKSVEADNKLADSIDHVKTISPGETGEAKKVNSQSTSPVNGHNITAGNMTNNVAKADSTLSKETSNVTAEGAAAVSSPSLPLPPPGPFFNKQNTNVGDKPLGGRFGLRQNLPTTTKREAPLLSAKKPLAVAKPEAPKEPLAVEKPTAVEKPVAPKKAEAPQIVIPQSHVTKSLKAPQQPVQDVGKQDFKPLIPSMKVEKRPVPVKPVLQKNMPMLDSAAISQPQPPVPAKKAPAKRVPPVQTSAPKTLQKPVQAKPMMKAPKPMRQTLQMPTLPQMPSRPPVDIKLNKRPSEPARPLQQRRYKKENANQRPVYPGFNAPSMKANQAQMYRYVPPNQPNYNFPMMPQWNSGYNYSYPTMPSYRYPVRPNGQQNGYSAQRGNLMQKNTTATPVENRKK